MTNEYIYGLSIKCSEPIIELKWANKEGIIAELNTNKTYHVFVVDTDIVTQDELAQYIMNFIKEKADNI